MRWTLACVCLIVVAPSVADAQPIDPAADAASPLGVRPDEISTLENGMRVVIRAENSAPGRVAAAWVAPVGVHDAAPGRTGVRGMIAELLQYESTDPPSEGAAAEADRIRRQNELRTRLRTAIVQTQIPRWRRGELAVPWTPETFDAVAMADARALAELVDDSRAADDAPPIQPMIRALADDARVEATPDAVLFAAELPADALAEWARLEAARLDAPVFRRFEDVRAARLAGPADPVQAAAEQLEAAFFQTTAYAAPARGWAMDVALMTRPRLADFYAEHFAPRELTVVIIGDVDPAVARETLDATLGQLPNPTAKAAGDADEPTPPWEAWQTSEIVVNVQGATPAARLMYHAPPLGHRDEAGFHILAAMLTADFARMGRGRSGPAPSAAVRAEGLSHTGVFVADFGAASNDDLEAALETWEEMRRGLMRAPVVGPRFEGAKAAALAALGANDPADLFARARRLALDLAMRPPAEAGTLAERVSAVPSGVLVRLAQIYLRPENRAVLRVRTPEGLDAEIASFPTTMQQQVRMLMQRLDDIEDPNVLRGLADQFRRRAAISPPQIRDALEFMVDRIDERLAGLEGGGDGEPDETPRE